MASSGVGHTNLGFVPDPTDVTSGNTVRTMITTGIKILSLTICCMVTVKL